MDHYDVARTAIWNALQLLQSDQQAVTTGHRVDTLISRLPQTRRPRFCANGPRTGAKGEHRSASGLSSMARGHRSATTAAYGELAIGLLHWTHQATTRVQDSLEGTSQLVEVVDSVILQHDYQVGGSHLRVEIVRPRDGLPPYDPFGHVRIMVIQYGAAGKELLRDDLDGGLTLVSDVLLVSDAE